MLAEEKGGAALSRKLKDTDFLHASARVRALENGMVPAADFRKMAEARSPEEAYKVLADAPICQGWPLEDYEKALDHSLEETYQLVEQISPAPALVKLFRLKYDGHNLKTAIKARSIGSDGRSLYSSLGSVPVAVLEEELHEGNFSSFPQPLAQSAAEAAQFLAKTGDPQVVDLLVDQGVLRSMSQLAAELDSPFLVNFVRTQVDLANIRAAVRMTRMGKDAAALRQVMTPGGALAGEELVQAALEGMDRLLERVGEWDYGPQLAPSFEDLRAGKSLTRFERLCDNLQVALVSRAKLIPFGMEPLAAYLYAKECEAKAARIVMASKLAGVTPQQIMERLRETYV